MSATKTPQPGLRRTSVSGRGLWMRLSVLGLGLAMAACAMTPAALWAQGAAPGPQLMPLPHPDIAAPDFPVNQPTPWWMVVGGILLGLLLTAGLLWLLLRERKPRPPAPHLPLKLAIESLESLRSRLDQSTPQEVAHEVSAILRDYLQLRYALPAPYRTTEEIYQSAAMASRQPLRERFEPVAMLYDRLEFAPRPSTAADSARLVDTALEALREEQKQQAQPAAIPPPIPASTGPATIPAMPLTPPPLTSPPLLGPPPLNPLPLPLPPAPPRTEPASLPPPPPLVPFPLALPAPGPPMPLAILPPPLPGASDSSPPRIPPPPSYPS